ncbi:MAG: ComF family protein [Actinomycetia bacterium]|nr:ComF family protein [Actinomycetes bacterium]
MVLSAVLDVVLGSRCAICDTAGPVVCGPCRGRLGAVRPGPAVEGLGQLVALFDYDRGGGDLITALKYRGRTSLARWLGSALGIAVLDRIQPRPSMVTWAPTTRDRRRSRGFDQSEVLAREVARVLRVPARPTLIRIGNEHQTGRPRSERRDSGPRFHTPSATAGFVLLVDDVVTTGATLVSARRALLVAGASGVAAGCVARVAAPSSAHQSRDVALDG